MRPEEGDVAYLWDMREQARRIVHFLEGITRERFLADEDVRLVVERRIEITGEAARRVSGEFRAAPPEIPWHQIVSQRNVLIHEYGEVIPELIWSTATIDMRALLTLLDPLLPLPPDLTA